MALEGLADPEKVVAGPWTGMVCAGGKGGGTEKKGRERSRKLEPQKPYRFQPRNNRPGQATESFSWGKAIVERGRPGNQKFAIFSARQRARLNIREVP